MVYAFRLVFWQDFSRLGGDEGRRPQSAPSVVADHPQLDVGKPNQCSIRLRTRFRVAFYGYFQTGEGVPYGPVSPSPIHHSIAVHCVCFFVRFVEVYWDAVFPPPWTGLVELRWKTLSDTFVRAIPIKFLSPPLKSPLLCLAIGTCRPTTFGFQRSVHSLVTAVVLRLARSDKFDSDPQGDPPCAQLAQPSRAYRSEWASIIHPDHLRQPIARKGSFKSQTRPLLRRLRHRFQSHKVTTVKVAYCQRIAALSIPEIKPSLVVRRPYLIDPLRLL